ncbi:MAG TPA: hypothetical protein VMF65_06580 [Acidimicrobiales bacterium]|nr:hypothetical protein [Acidimicrobiales bacterium]
MSRFPRAAGAFRAPGYAAWAGSAGGPSSLAPSATIRPGGAVSSGASMGLSGYSIVEAGDSEEATKMALGCPLINAGGTIEVYESLPMG